MDFALINQCGYGDIVVTQDYGVAAMALGKGACAIHQSGRWYTDANIDQMLMERHLNKKARKSKNKNHLKGLAKRTQEDYPIRIVGTASNGTDALNLIRKEKPDLAFMDIHMPFMTGFDVIQKTQDVKFIIITAYDSFEHAQMALRLEVSDILAKPIRLDQLRQSIDRALGGKYTENSTVNAALAYIQKHYREDIRLGNLAEEVCCTESHLSRLFRQYMDETVISYLHHVRIKKAANLLKDGMSVQEAAEEAGYQSLNNFYKYFKQFMKETPAAYLKK